MYAVSQVFPMTYAARGTLVALTLICATALAGQTELGTGNQCWGPDCFDRGTSSSGNNGSSQGHTTTSPEASQPDGPWCPSALTPVFYGREDVRVLDGAPVDLRVFYPSLDGNPRDARLFRCHEAYPLVLFLHGSCPEESQRHYKSWNILPLTLARSGFVVVVPNIAWNPGDHPSTHNAEQHTAALETLDWVRTRWGGRSQLSNDSQLGLVGHSFGALLAGRLSTEVSNSALVSIGGWWSDWRPIGELPINDISVPSLFLLGTNDSNATLPEPNWNAVPRPLHRALFNGKGHWDHLDSIAHACGQVREDDCGSVESMTADLTALFLSKYLHRTNIPDSLRPPLISLTAEQEFYAGLNLVSFNQLASASCDAQVTLKWDASNNGDINLPWGSSSACRLSRTGKASAACRTVKGRVKNTADVRGVVRP